MKYFFKFFIFFGVLFSVVVSHVHAENATLYFETQAGKGQVGSEITLKLFVDSASDINALDVSLAYPGSLTLVNYDTTGSVVSFWRSGDVTRRAGHIVLSGGMITPFSGTHGYLASLIFHVNEEGASTVAFDRTNLFKADGSATKISASAKSFTFLAEKVGEKIVSAPTHSFATDETAPELFAETSSDPVNGIPLLVFSAKDPESGIQTTEMRYKRWFAWSNWQQVQNPAPYPSAAWGIEIRAMNTVGRMSQKTIVHTGVLYSKLIAVLILGIIVGVGAFKIFSRHSHLR